jgi:hypothetical protein
VVLLAGVVKLTLIAVPTGSDGHWKVISEPETNKRGAGVPFTVTWIPFSVVPKFPDCGAKSVNPEPAIFSQLPGLQAFAEALLAEFVSPVMLTGPLDEPVERLIVVVTVAFQFAVIVTACVLPLTVPAAAVNVALVAVAGIVIVAGTVTKFVLLERLIVTPVLEACESDTVHVAL